MGQTQIPGQSFYQIFELYCLLGSAILLTIVTYLKYLKFARYSLIVQFCQIILPCLLTFTIWADYYFPIFAFFALLYIYLRNYKSLTLSDDEETFREENIFDRFSEITGERRELEHDKVQAYGPGKGNINLSIIYIKGYCIILTIIAILAVDFPSIYPKRHEKSLNYGFTAMDTGAAIIVFGSGLAFGVSTRSIINKSDFIQVFACFLIGSIRVFVVKRLEYQEKIEEYGVHWNFFFTLGILKILAEVFLRPGNGSFRSQTSSSKRTFMTSLIFLVPIILPIIYEIFLNLKFFVIDEVAPDNQPTGFKSLKDFILNADHQIQSTGFDSLKLKRKLGFYKRLYLANREGLYSTLGYFSIYAYGNLLSNLYFYKNNKPSLEKLGSFFRIFIGLTFFVLPFCVVFIDDGSRRLGNLTFVVWMYGINAMFLYLSEEQLYHFKVNHLYQFSKLLHLYGKYQFSAFILANIITGLVNMSFETGSASSTTAFVIMLVYMIIISVFVYLREAYSRIFRENVTVDGLGKRKSGELKKGE